MGPNCICTRTQGWAKIRKFASTSTHREGNALTHADVDSKIIDFEVNIEQIVVNISALVIQIFGEKLVA